jgi:membrane protein DedA with SNARE-associated domain
LHHSREILKLRAGIPDCKRPSILHNESGRREFGGKQGGGTVEEFLQSWGYLGIFLGIIATGVGFPMPEELPIVVAGGRASRDLVDWWLMLPVCIAGVVIGDGCLYAIGRFWGRHLLEYKWVKTRILPPERLRSIEQNFQQHGIKILLFARLTPGVRAPIFLTAGLTRLSLGSFVVADAIYAVPGVSLLFALGYFFTDSMVNLIKNDVEQIKHIIILVIIVGVAGYFLYRFLRRPMVTGDPKEIPPLVEQVTHTLGQVKSKIMHPLGGGNETAADCDGRPRPGQESKPSLEDNQPSK